MRNASQLAAEIVKWQQYLACDPAPARAEYAREKIAYLVGELELQEAYERKQAEGLVDHDLDVCSRCGGERWKHPSNGRFANICQDFPF